MLNRRATGKVRQIYIVEYGVVEKGDDNQKLVGWPTGWWWWWWWRVIVTRWGGALSGLIAGPVQQHNTLMKHMCVCVCPCMSAEWQMTEEWWCFMRMYVWWTRINAYQSSVGCVSRHIFCDRLFWKKMDLMWLCIPQHGDNHGVAFDFIKTCGISF